MASDLDIWRTANLLVKHHGSNASIVAAQCADERLANGDIDGFAVWKRITKAIEELLRSEPRKGETLN